MSEATFLHLSMFKPTLKVEATTFQIREDGTFAMCKTLSDSSTNSRSEADSHRAKITTTPDIDSLPLNKPWDPHGTADSPSLRAQAKIATVADDFSYIGCWENSLYAPDGIVPWRMEPVRRQTGRSVAETVDSGSGLTEASTRDSDSICLSDRAQRHEEDSFPMPEYVTLSPMIHATVFPRHTTMDIPVVEPLQVAQDPIGLANVVRGG
ncbi:hypothetical protein OQA88_8644 [Cercophora sp. LCS_1]